MKYHLLGRTGLRVSELCLGTMTFGGKGKAMWEAIGALDEKASTELVARALDAGINFFDTADMYASGESEEITGRALGDRKHRVVIATKCAFPCGDGPNDAGLSRAHILDACDASLRRLGVEHIDLYQVHKPDRLTPIDETMKALDDLVRWGKVRYIGASNFLAWQMMKANSVASANHGARFESAQMYYNLIARDLERDIVPFLKDQQISLLVWSPLASGALTGKYSPEGKPPADSRRASFDLGPLDRDRLKRIIDAAKPIAESHRTTITRVTLAWLLAQDVVTSVILGAKKMHQLEDNLGATDLTLSADEITKLNAASELPAEYPGWFLKQFGEM